MTWIDDKGRVWCPATAADAEGARAQRAQDCDAPAVGESALAGILRLRAAAVAAVKKAKQRGRAQ